MAENKDYVRYICENGSVNISEEVLCSIAGNAALEVDGVSALYTNAARELAEIMGRKGFAKGVKIRMEDGAMLADIFVVVDPNVSLAAVGTAVQDAVKSAVEATVGITVKAVNVNVCGLQV